MRGTINADNTVRLAIPTDLESPPTQRNAVAKMPDRSALPSSLGLAGSPPETRTRGGSESIVAACFGDEFTELQSISNRDGWHFMQQS